MNKENEANQGSAKKNGSKGAKEHKDDIEVSKK